MPVINQNTPVENIQVPVPTSVNTKPKKSSTQTPPAVQQVQSRQPRLQHAPLSFGGENDEFGRRTQGVSAVILPWSPQPKAKQLSRKLKQLSRKRIQVITYKRPSLTPEQKERAKKVELVVLPTGIEGKKCGTCKYAKHHTKDKDGGLYCFNNQVHMNVKSNWGCKLWDAKGVKRLQRPIVKSKSK